MRIGCNLIAFCWCSDKLEVLTVSLVLDESRCLVTHRVSRRSRDLSNMEAEISGSLFGKTARDSSTATQTETETANYDF